MLPDVGPITSAPSEFVFSFLLATEQIGVNVNMTWFVILRYLHVFLSFLYNLIGKHDLNLSPVYYTIDLLKRFDKVYK
jgi:hypothetical protein